MARGHEVGQDVLVEPPAHAVHAIVDQAGRLAAPADRGDCTQRALGEFTQALAEAPSVRVVGEVGLQGGENPAVALAQRREHAPAAPDGDDRAPCRDHGLAHTLADDAGGPDHDDRRGHGSSSSKRARPLRW